MICYLLSEEWQIKSGEVNGITIGQYALPVNASALKENLYEKLSFCEGGALDAEQTEKLQEAVDEMAEELEKITTVRFCAREKKLLKEKKIDQ